MKRGLQIFDIEHLDEIVAHGFSMVRIDCQHDAPEAIHAIVREIIDVGLEPVVIVDTVEQLDAVPEKVRIELGNEPDLETQNWPNAGIYTDRGYQFIEHDEGRHPLYFGAVSNLNKRGYAYLKQLPWHDEAWARVCCSFHRYPDRTPEQSHMWDLTFKYPFKQYWTRDMEIEELRRIVGWNRPLMLTETGYNRSGHTPEQQVEGLRYEREFAEKHGYDAILYQIHSGTGDETKIGESYGVRDHNTGEWREPLVEAWLGA